MKRREFITLLGCAAAAWPLTARAQQTGRIRQVGILLPTSASDPEWARNIGALTETLRTSGWIEGQTVTFVIRYADAPGRLSVLAAELAAANVDVIVTMAAALNEGVRRATRTIPVVMAASGDAVGAGLVTSLARPGGNITGLTLLATETVVKRLQLVKSFSTDWTRIAVFFNSNAPAHRLQITALEQAVSALGLALQSFPNTSADDVGNNLHAAVNGNNQVIFTLDDPMIESHRERIVGFAMRQHLPVIAENRPMLVAGALMNYSPNKIHLWQRAGAYVDKILRGAKAADLPVEQPTRFEFVINLKTARALGIDVPPSLLAVADEVIE